jgi:hypothetical protein
MRKEISSRFALEHYVPEYPGIHESSHDVELTLVRGSVQLPLMVSTGYVMAEQVYSLQIKFV